MTYAKTLMITTLAGAAFIPAAAFAGDMETKKSVTVVEDGVERTLTPAETETVTLAAVARAASDQDNTYVIVDERGEIFVNHVLSEDELSPVGTDVDVVDTVTYEYNGRTYTNKIVAE